MGTRKYIITLTSEERKVLTRLVSAGQDKAYRIKHANILLAADSNAVFHDVYFGTDRDAVADADTSNTTGIYRGRQSITSYTFPEGLPGTGSYYWRIDEVSSEGMIVTGEVWSFTTASPSGPPKGRGCFTGDTPVWSNGVLIPISKVAPGQVVCVMDSPSKIEEVQEHSGMFACYDVVLESGNCITVAECHYFMTKSGQWMGLHNLKTGTELKTSEGTIRIINITKRPMPYIGKVFNLKIDGSDRYWVGKDAIVVRDY